MLYFKDPGSGEVLFLSRLREARLFFGCGAADCSHGVSTARRGSWGKSIEMLWFSQGKVWKHGEQYLVFVCKRWYLI
jgi:hypothetical protein